MTLNGRDNKKVNMIITSIVQVTKKNMINMKTIRNANKFIYTNLKFKRIILIENLKKLPSLLPVDHSMITACELWLTSIHLEVYLAKMSINLTYQCQKFKEIVQKLRGITSSQDEREDHLIYLKWKIS